MTAVLRAEDITVRYGALVALQDLQLVGAGGEILGIIGPNGAGKSSCFAAVTNSVPMPDGSTSAVRTSCRSARTCSRCGGSGGSSSRTAFSASYRCCRMRWRPFSPSTRQD